MSEKKEFDTLKKQVEEEVMSKGEHYKKDVDVIWDGRQFGIKIPKKVADAIKMNKGDKFRFHLLPNEEGFDLKIELIQNG